MKIAGNDAIGFTFCAASSSAMKYSNKVAFFDKATLTNKPESPNETISQIHPRLVPAGRVIDSSLTDCVSRTIFQVNDVKAVPIPVVTFFTFLIQQKFMPYRGVCEQRLGRMEKRRLLRCELVGVADDSVSVPRQMPEKQTLGTPFVTQGGCLQNESVRSGTE